MMRIVIMADGKGTRWNNYLGIPKHLAQIDDEKIISRTVRLLDKICGGDREIIITSHDLRYEFEGSIRYEPINNHYEIDRFTEELITDDMIFLYGDTYYTEKALREIISVQTDSILFFGDTDSIVAVKIKNSELFRKHKNNVKDMYLSGSITECKGWQVYQSFTAQDMTKPPAIKDKFVVIRDRTQNINTPDDYEGIR